MRIILIEINGIINRTSTKFDEKILKTQGARMLLVSAYTGNLDLIPPRSFGRDPPSIRWDLLFVLVRATYQKTENAIHFTQQQLKHNTSYSLATYQYRSQ